MDNTFVDKLESSMTLKTLFDETFLIDLQIAIVQ